jgi:subtilisin family serine protease
MSLRVLDNTGTGDVGSAVEAIDYAVQHGAEVINLSWGTAGYSLALKDAIERALRRGVVVVCSAGNNGQNVDSIPYCPASFGLRDLIAVAATDNYDQLTSWSDYGHRNVTIAAPGINILTTQMAGGYLSVSGTSASAPVVTGVAGLIKSVSPSLNPRVCWVDRWWRR